MFEDNSPRNTAKNNRVEEKKSNPGQSAANQFVDEGLSFEQISVVNERRLNKSSLGIGHELNATPDLAEGPT